MREKDCGDHVDRQTVQKEVVSNAGYEKSCKAQDEHEHIQIESFVEKYEIVYFNESKF